MLIHVKTGLQPCLYSSVRDDRRRGELARVLAMAAAHENAARMVEAAQAEERELRQEAITAEIVELAAGLRARSETS